MRLAFFSSAVIANSKMDYLRKVELFSGFISHLKEKKSVRRVVGLEPTTQCATLTTRPLRICLMIGK